jgi:hypothetical protein
MDYAARPTKFSRVPMTLRELFRGAPRVLPASFRLAGGDGSHRRRAHLGHPAWSTRTGSGTASTASDSSRARSCGNLRRRCVTAPSFISVEANRIQLIRYPELASTSGQGSRFPVRPSHAAFHPVAPGSGWHSRARPDCLVNPRPKSGLFAPSLPIGAILDEIPLPSFGQTFCLDQADRGGIGGSAGSSRRGRDEGVTHEQGTVARAAGNQQAGGTSEAAFNR